MGRVTITDYSNGVDIAKIVGGVEVAIPVMIKSGQGALKAGTLIGGDAGNSILKGTATKAIKVNDATTEGVLLFDVDATSMDKEGTMVIAGILDLTKVTTGNGAAPAAAVVLKDIQFVK